MLSEVHLASRLGKMQGASPLAGRKIIPLSFGVWDVHLEFKLTVPFPELRVLYVSALGMHTEVACHAWQAAIAQPVFTIDQVTLSVVPGSEVASGSNLTLRCEARVSHSLPQPLSHTFSFLQDDQLVYAENISASVVEHTLSPARVSNSGHYQCLVRIYNKSKSSNSKAVRVTGLQTPMLMVKSDIIPEGEDIMATCSALEETGSLIFYFYEDNQEVKRVISNSNSVTTTLAMQKLTDVYLHCVYMIKLHPNAGLSNKSNMVKVVVQGLDVITPFISISPKINVVEGDRVQITCQVHYSSDLELFLTKGNTVLRKSFTTFTYSLTVRAEDSGEYVCKAEKGSVQKTAAHPLHITELYRRPILEMSPPEVFEGERFSLSCSSAVKAPERIKKTDIRYILLKEDRRISAIPSYEDTASLVNNGRYFCLANAKGVNKTSLPVLLKAKVPVSTPRIHAVDNVILGRPFKVSCEAKNGTFPITYTLLKGRIPVAERTVVEASDQAIFIITSISYPEEIYSFTCQAYNRGPSFIKTSEVLGAPVTVPVSRPVLEPQEVTVTEGSDLVLICKVQHGSNPITFTWYHNKIPLPLSRQEIQSSVGRHVVHAIQRDQRGDYYCEASNYAAETKRSYAARVGGLVNLSVEVVEPATNQFPSPSLLATRPPLVRKPSRPKSGDPMRMSLTLDIEDNTALN
ncbi:hypothetical protein DNTS_001649, partial [Danionella cerebrum]